MEYEVAHAVALVVIAAALGLWTLYIVRGEP